MANMKLLPLASLGGMVLGLILLIVGVATPHWSHGDFAVVTTDAGLFRSCNNVAGCTDVPVKTDSWKACDAFAILAVLFGTAATGLALFHTFAGFKGMNQNNKFPRITLAASCVASASVIICAAIWVAKIHNPDPLFLSLGYSFYLAIVGAVFIDVGGVVFFLSSRLD